MYIKMLNLSPPSHTHTVTFISVAILCVDWVEVLELIFLVKLCGNPRERDFSQSCEFSTRDSGSPSIGQKLQHL